MAVSAIKVTLGTSLGEGKFNSATSYPADPVVTAAAVPSTAAVAAAVAALVADGATPTQAHVTTLNTAWGTLLTAITTYETAVQSSASGNLVILIDTAVITTSNAVKWAISQALQAAKNLGIVTP
jgi:uncharacterized membrane protein